MIQLPAIATAALKKGAGYIRDDRTSYHGLKVPRWITLQGKGIGVGNFCSGGFCIHSEKGGGQITLTTEPFEAESRNWLGPLWVPDTLDDGSLEASLWQSLLIRHRDAAMKACKIKAAAYDRWCHSIYVAAWKAYAAALHPGAKFNGARQYALFNAAMWESWVKRFAAKVAGAVGVAALCAALCCAFSGCSSPEKWTVAGFGDGPAPTNLVMRAGN